MSSSALAHLRRRSLSHSASSVIRTQPWVRRGLLAQARVQHQFYAWSHSRALGTAKFELRRPVIDWDPSSLDKGEVGAFLGIAVKPEDASLVIIPVPWAATASAGASTAEAPEKIMKISGMLDLFQTDTVELGLGDPWKFGISALPVDPDVKAWCAAATAAAEADDIATVDKISSQLHAWVEKTAATYLAAGQRVAVLGGDHSTPLGLMRAVGSALGSYGILHIDAHLDMRPHRQDEFKYGHDKIMYNALEEASNLDSFISVGPRDFCRSELDVAHHDSRVILYLEKSIRRRLNSGETWNVLAREIVSRLPDQVYLSVDVDGLQPELFPTTGTPVPGGLSFREVIELVLVVLESGRTIIGFDLAETGSGHQDCISAGHLLYKISAALLQSNGARDVMPDDMAEDLPRSASFDDASGYAVPYEVRSSPGMGMGVFSTSHIPKGTLIWRARCMQRFDKETAFEHMSKLSQARRNQFSKHAFCFEGTINFIHDDNRYTNHSDEPTCGSLSAEHAAREPFRVYSLRDIAPGEELTESYSEWPMPEWVPDLDKAFPTDTEVPFCVMALAKEDFKLKLAAEQ